MKVAAVAIGRNEGDRLRRCLDSLLAEGLCTVYVDSGSNDGSVALARSLSVDVVELDPARPFSAARARNEGFGRCLNRDPAVEAVMFVDGDCEVVSGWLARAAAELTRRPELAVVCGRRSETDPKRSVFNRLADLEWDTPIGLAASCGGDALMRVSDFQRVGGFDPTARAGEEPELCQRLRQAGRLIARIDTPMTRHDLAMTRLGQWWRRAERVGYHGLDSDRRFPPSPGADGTISPSLFGAGLRRARVWALGGSVVGPVLVGLAAWWGGLLAALGALGLILALLGAQALRLAWKVRHRVTRWTDALIYGGLMILEKWANLAGQIRYLADQRAGRGSRLIEYRGLAESESVTQRADA